MQVKFAVAVLSCAVLALGYLAPAYAGLEGTNESSVPTFSTSVRKTQADYIERIMVDNQLRYIGGNAAVHDADTPQTRMIPTMKFPFSVSTKQGRKSVPAVTIGIIQGVNTERAHELGQSNVDHVSTPVVVKLNGQKIAYIQENGEDIRVEVPENLINKDGVNVIQVQTGHYMAAPDTIAVEFGE